MRLNPDCVRDILLYIESNTNFSNSIIDSIDLIKELKDYDKDTIFYHLQMIEQANLVDNIFWAENEPYTISNLSWEGHQYLDNIRDDKVWRNLKDYTSKVSSISLQLLISLAPTILEKILLKS